MPRFIRQRVFIEIFSGVGRLGAAVAQLGGSILCWDISCWPQYDLTCIKHQQLLRGWVSANLVWGIHLGTPCSSFSIARSGRPPPLRSAESPLGLPDLSPADTERVRIGNVLARFSAGLLLLGRRPGVPCTVVENPQSSRLLLFPAFVAPAKFSVYRVALTNLCMYGTPLEESNYYRRLQHQLGSS